MKEITMSNIVEQLKKCGFECEAGPLELNTAFIELEKMAESEKGNGDIGSVYLIDAAERLNQERGWIVGGLIKNAKETDGTYIGAVQYLRDFVKDCIKYDDECRFDSYHIQSDNLRREALYKIQRQFEEEVENHQKAKIW